MRAGAAGAWHGEPVYARRRGERPTWPPASSRMRAPRSRRRSRRVSRPTCRRPPARVSCSPNFRPTAPACRRSRRPGTRRRFARAPSARSGTHRSDVSGRRPGHGGVGPSRDGGRAISRCATSACWAGSRAVGRGRGHERLGEFRACVAGDRAYAGWEGSLPIFRRSRTGGGAQGFRLRRAGASRRRSDFSGRCRGCVPFAHGRESMDDRVSFRTEVSAWITYRGRTDERPLDRKRGGCSRRDRGRSFRLWRRRSRDVASRCVPRGRAARRGHHPLSCDDCHEAYDQAPSCYGCHGDDFEHSSFDHSTFGSSTACAACHTPLGWSPSTFHHDIFPLTGAHASVPCTRCHTGTDPTATPTDCYACHRDDFENSSFDHSIVGSSTAAPVSHTTTAWSPSTFNHDGFGFPLAGRHASISCVSCHIDSVWAGQPTDCEACHWTRSQDDPWRLALGSHCTDCHTPEGWAGAPFDHSARTGFVLTGAHASIACVDCHPGHDASSTAGHLRRVPRSGCPGGGAPGVRDRLRLLSRHGGMVAVDVQSRAALPDRQRPALWLRMHRMPHGRELHRLHVRDMPRAGGDRCPPPRGLQLQLRLRRLLSLPSDGEGRGRCSARPSASFPHSFSVRLPLDRRAATARCWSDHGVADAAGGGSAVAAVRFVELPAGAFPARALVADAAASDRSGPWSGTGRADSCPMPRGSGTSRAGCQWQAGHLMPLCPEALR